MHDEWAERLSGYVDGDITSEDRVLLEAHLETCPTCPPLLVELRGVIESARALPAIAPASDLWPGIEARIASLAREERPAADRRPRGVVASWPQLAAAGLALVALSGGGAWFAARTTGPARTAVALPTGAPEVTPASRARALDRELSGELEQLEQVLAERRSELDPETVKTIESNLAIIDLATTQAREALAADPANPYLREYLSKTMKRKIVMLKEATVLASAQ
jgi:anti-sigma factor RsiW